ncbi:MAG: hypothetical protein HY049_02990 [Acidobacteria bacterium]|nr:hypothetical protein [Acidobacteriota bacterium]
MTRILPNAFVAVFRTEILFNLKRVAPYALMVLFSANAVLWWGWGPAGARGWAVNSDFFIVWLLGGFSFLTMPLFVAMMMGDPVIRDYRIGVDPLIFSRPVRPVEYLLGKFAGNFVVLVCAQAFFVLAPLLLQSLSLKGMIVLPPRVLPYFQHFFFFVVVSSLAMATVFFTVGTLTRNVKIVYALATSFYPLYAASQIAMKNQPGRWRVFLDPVLFNVGGNMWQGRSSDWLNHLTVGYDEYMVVNRVLMLGISVSCLAILISRFSACERGTENGAYNAHSILGLGAWPIPRHEERRSPGARDCRQAEELEVGRPPALARVMCVTPGWRATAGQFMASLGVECRLLRSERTLVVIAPLIVLSCVLDLLAFGVVPEISYAASYAARTADSALLVLFGVAVFFTGESMHRDRELGVEPVLWSVPAPNSVLLLSKLAATLLLSAGLIVLVALAALCVQVCKGNAPLEPLVHVKTYAVILLPSAVFMCGASLALNVLLRDKYLTYAVSLAAGGAVYYLSSQGHDTWLYNPTLYGLWTPSDLSGSHLSRIFVHRIYCLALSVFLLALAFIRFERKPTREVGALGLLNARGWSLVIAALAGVIAIITGLTIAGSG